MGKRQTSDYRSVPLRLHPSDTATLEPGVPAHLNTERVHSSCRAYIDKGLTLPVFTRTEVLVVNGRQDTVLGTRSLCKHLYHNICLTCNQPMDQQCMSTPKVCSFYENSPSTYLGSTLFNGNFAVSPYGLCSGNPSELSCSLISSTTLDLIEHKMLNSEWMASEVHQNFSSGDNSSELGLVGSSIPFIWTSDTTDCDHKSTDTSASKPSKKRRSNKSSYKHVPHREKPVHLVARRNARERKRVQAVNSAFVRLRKCVPVENRNKRLSKVKTLHRAIEYIGALEKVLQETDQLTPCDSAVGTDYAKELHQSMESRPMEVTHTPLGNGSLGSLCSVGGNVYLPGQCTSAGLSVQSLLMTGARADCSDKYTFKGSHTY